MTARKPADLADTVREYITRSTIPAANEHSPVASDVVAALDALAAQAGDNQPPSMWMTVVPSDQYERERLRAEAAEAERDRLADALQRLADGNWNRGRTYEPRALVNFRDFARAALDGTGQP